MSKKTLSLGLAQETLTKFNSFANTGERGKVSAGGEFGCVLALYDGKFKISEIAQTGPAALSGLVAVGDELVAVDGKCLRESGARLQELTAGEEGFPVWLELKPRSKSSLESPSRTVRLIRQSPLDAKGWALSDVSSNISSSASSIKSSLPSVSTIKSSLPSVSAITPSFLKAKDVRASQPAPSFDVGPTSIQELGIEVKLSPQGHVQVSSISEGGAAWLSAQGALEDSGGVIAADDMIIDIDGHCCTHPLSGEDFQKIVDILRGASNGPASFTRVRITLNRGETTKTIEIVRAPPLKAQYLSQAKNFQQRVAALPATAPSERISRRKVVVSCPRLLHVRPANQTGAKQNQTGEWSMAAEEAGALISAVLPAPPPLSELSELSTEHAPSCERGVGHASSSSSAGFQSSSERLFDLNLTQGQRVCASSLICAALLVRCSKAERIAALNDALGRSSKQTSAHHARELGTAGGGGDKTRQKDGTEEGGPQEYIVYSEAVLLSAIVNSFGIQGSLRQEVDERCRQDLELEGRCVQVAAEDLVQHARDTPQTEAARRAAQEAEDRAAVERERALWFDSPEPSPVAADEEAPRTGDAEAVACSERRRQPCEESGFSASHHATTFTAEHAHGLDTHVREVDVGVAVGGVAVKEECEKTDYGEEEDRGTCSSASSDWVHIGEHEKEEFAREERLRAYVGETEEEIREREREERENEELMRAEVGGLQWIVCWLMLATAVQSQRYDARARGALRRICRELGVPWKWLSAAEVIICTQIVQRQIALHEAAQKEAETSAGAGAKQQGVGKYKRMGYIGGAAVLGGLVFAASGGLAAPAVVAGMGLCGSAVGAHVVIGAGTLSGLTTVLSVGFGGYGAGLVGNKVARRIGDVEEFELDIVDVSMGLPITIGVPGWLNNSQDNAWKVWDEALCSGISDGGDALALRFESRCLYNLGNLLTNYLKSQIKNWAITEAGTVVIGAAFATLALPLKLTRWSGWIDNTWAMCTIRADQAGEMLAILLASRTHGRRPVTLIGFGMGARLIFKCLTCLAKMGANGLGIVESAILLGTPVSADAALWSEAASVCGYRLVNGFSRNDWVLGFVYRCGTLLRTVAGLCPITPDGKQHAGDDSSEEQSSAARAQDVRFCNAVGLDENETPPLHSAIENLDLTGVIKGHWDYRDKLPELVKICGLASGVSSLPPQPPPSVAGESMQEALKSTKDTIKKHAALAAGSVNSAASAASSAATSASATASATATAARAEAARVGGAGFASLPSVNMPDMKMPSIPKTLAYGLARGISMPSLSWNTEASILSSFEAPSSEAGGGRREGQENEEFTGSVHSADKEMSNQNIASEELDASKSSAKSNTTHGQLQSPALVPAEAGKRTEFFSTEWFLDDEQALGCAGADTEISLY